MATTSNSHLLLSVPSASRQLLQVGEPAQRTGFSVVQKNHFSTAEAQRAQSKELSELCWTWDEEVV